MIRWEIIILLGLVVTDIVMTYLLMYFLKEKLHVKDYYKYERNPIVKRLVAKHGLHKGIRFSFVWAIMMWLFVIVYLSIRVNWFDFSRLVFLAIGIYIMMNTLHFYTLQEVLAQVKKKKG